MGTLLHDRRREVLLRHEFVDFSVGMHQNQVQHLWKRIVMWKADDRIWVELNLNWTFGFFASNKSRQITTHASFVKNKLHRSPSVSAAAASGDSFWSILGIQFYYFESRIEFINKISSRNINLQFSKKDYKINFLKSTKRVEKIFKTYIFSKFLWIPNLHVHICVEKIQIRIKNANMISNTAFCHYVFRGNSWCGRWVGCPHHLCGFDASSAVPSNLHLMPTSIT